MRITWCLKLAYLFSVPLAQGLVHLEVHEIRNCDSMEHLIIGAESDYSLCWSKLRSLQIMSCKSLKYVFPITLAQGLVHLEVLEIQHCDSLEHLIIGAESDYSLCLSKLRTLQISECESLKYVFPITLAQGLVHLEVLEIHYCDSLEHLIIEAESDYSMCLSKLRTLEIMKCKSLKYVFPITLAQGLVHLEVLEILYCDSMEHLIIETEIDYSLCWSKLRTLRIINCESLKYVFPISVARSLSNLNSINIQGTSKLKQVFGYEGELNVEDDEKGIGYNFPFPSLNHLKVEGCPYLITRFSEESRGIMHAITEAPQQVEQNTAEGLTTTDEIVDNLPTCNDIFWYRDLEETEDDVTE